MAGKTKPYVYTVLIVLSVLHMGVAGCGNTPDEQAATAAELNVNTPEIFDLEVSVNGGITAPVTRIQWDWGDGTIDRHAYFPASHLYKKSGTYTITVTVFTAANRSLSKAVTVTVQ